MNPGFQEGRRPRANAVASLAHTGHVSPLGRRPGLGFAAHGQHPGTASRPGPQPISASMAAAVNRRNAATEKIVSHVLRKVSDQVQLPSLPFSAYQPGAPGRSPWVKGTDINGQTWYRTQVQELWVYSHAIDRWGTREFKVYNPKTKAWASFTPQGYIADKEQGQAVASATGEFGRVYANTLGTIVVVATGGVALEAGAGTVAMEYAAPFMTEEILTGAGIRAGTDAGVQLISGFATGKGSAWQRTKYAVANVNATSIIVAALINTEGMRLPTNWFAKTGVKMLIAGGTAAAGNLVTVSIANIGTYGTGWHGVDFHDSDERNNFFIGVGLSAGLDVGKEYATDFLAPSVAKFTRRTIASASGRALMPTLRPVNAKLMTWPTSFGIGTVSEIRKKRWEKNKEEEKKAAAATKRANQVIGKNINHDLYK